MVTTETIPMPLTDADMAFTYYGVHFDPVGEEGTPILALGHVEPRRMVAAANQYMRVDVGEYRGLGSYRRHTRWLDEVQHGYAVRIVDCDSSHEEDHRSDCGECAEMRRPHGWYVRWNATKDTPGAFPVALLHV